MDIGRAITYPFDDDEWLQKLGLGVLIQLIPIVGAFVLQGWSLEISRRVKRNDPTPLPNWQTFGDFLREGFLIFVAQLIYQLPTVLVICVASFVWVIPAMGGDNENMAAVLGGATAIVLGCCLCLIFIYALAAAVVFWGGYVRYIENPEFSTFFEFGDNLALVRENLGDFGMILLAALAAGLVISAVSGITFGLAGLVSTPVIMYFIGHLLGQLTQKLNPPMGGEPPMPAMPAV
jgi:hypothetical protein